MPWMNREQLEEHYSNPEVRQAIKDLFTLSGVLRHATLSTDYSAPAGMDSIVVLTDIGEELKEHAAANSSRRAPDIHMALFLIFAYQEPVIDLSRTDVSGMSAVMSDEIAKLRIRYPCLVGRELYDKFVDLYGDRDSLSADETQRLLADTNQGVFQARQFVTGPFGLLESSTSRLLQPTRDAPLSHCPDPGCQATHNVTLRSSPTDVRLIYDDFLARVWRL